MKKATILNILLLVFLTSSVWAVGSLEREVRDLDRFSSLSVATGIQLTLVKGNSHKAEIEAENIDIEEIVTKIDENRLIVKVKSNKWGMNWWKNRKRKVNVTLTYTELDKVSASSGARVVSDDIVSSSSLEFDASSGASINLEIDGGDVEADASSGSSIKLSGECESLAADVSSGANIKASDLEANRVDSSASSGGTARVWAKEGLYARASSGGSVKYKGNPESLDKKKSSGGSVKQM